MARPARRASRSTFLPSAPQSSFIAYWWFHEDMTPRSGATALALAVFIAGWPIGSAQAHQKRLRSCAPRYGTTLLLSDKHAQVYQEGAGIYACLRRGGHVSYLGHSRLGGNGCAEMQERCGEVSEEALTGTVVAYAETRFTPRGQTLPQRIVVRNITNGSLLHGFSLYVATLRRVMIEQASAIRLQVTPDGAVAWIQEDWFASHGGPPRPPTSYEIYAVDSGGIRTLSPELSTIPRSLQLHGRRLTWLEAGTPGSADLR